MSVVTGVVLSISVCEEDGSLGEDGPPALVEAVNEWLTERHFGRLRPVEDSFGGSKHPQIRVFGGGYNFLPEDDFAAFVMGLSWESPENVILVMNPEVGSTRVLRPAGVG